MKLVQTIKELQSELDALRSEGKTIGLVPTMGALHAGHASLVKRAVAENDVVVVSDFVNPTQFNDKNDLAKYPRTLDADCELLEKANFPLRRTILIRSGGFPVLLIYITRTLLNDYGIITFSCNRGIRMFLMRNLRYGPWLSIIMLLLVI